MDSTPLLYTQAGETPYRACSSVSVPCSHIAKKYADTAATPRTAYRGDQRNSDDDRTSSGPRETLQVLPVGAGQQLLPLQITLVTHGSTRSKARTGKLP
jgi:hypothetical protein